MLVYGGFRCVLFLKAGSLTVSFYLFCYFTAARAAAAFLRICAVAAAFHGGAHDVWRFLCGPLRRQAVVHCLWPSVDVVAWTLFCWAFHHLY